MQREQKDLLHAGASEGVEYAGDGSLVTLQCQSQLLHIHPGLFVYSTRVLPLNAQRAM